MDEIRNMFEELRERGCIKNEPLPHGYEKPVDTDRGCDYSTSIVDYRTADNTGNK